MAIVGLHHVRVRSNDLDSTERFAHDFGLVTVERGSERLIMRTEGGDPYCYIADKAEASGFSGFAFEAAFNTDLAKLASQLGVEPPRQLDLPGGGAAIRLSDPDGFQIEIIAGTKRGQAHTTLSELQMNSPSARKRLGLVQRRSSLCPPQLFRLGHMAIFVENFERSLEWYQANLGLIASDIYHVPGNPSVRIVGFLRLNRGPEWVDHHVLALFQRPSPDLHHISFEVQDYETQFAAHRWLESRGHPAVWGVGRHPHGSHVFDVWKDPNGYRFETFSDTDLFNSSRPTALHDISANDIDIWRPDPPDRYFA